MSNFSIQLLTWFDQHGRTNLPWQAIHSNHQEGVTNNLKISQHEESCTNVYHVWLSEIMLQQTQVATVIDYFNRFTQVFPTLDDLAHASEDAVLAQWAGLGYYARARNLHKTAKIIVCEYDGKFPQEFEQVIALPGIGRSTAGAILSLSFKQKHTILDGNVKRVLARVHQVEGHYSQSATLNQLWQLADHYTPNTRTDHYTQAIMDLGATICTRSQPKCSHCPVDNLCNSNKNQTQSEYPIPKPKKIKPNRSIAMLVFIKNGHIHLYKRPSKGIWGGLWSFIECEDNPETINQALLEFDPSCSIITKLPIFKHTFTHYHLNIHTIIVSCSQNNHHKFYNPKLLSVGTPKPVSSIISQLDKHTKQTQ
ncbi:MAG TPA: A/G-specific adenine glycosylase [Candidatus Thioglobus sp.]|nr:A/G-specific adenine glycosylase [Candidatus Thioglobus sp.]